MDVSTGHHTEFKNKYELPQMQKYSKTALKRTSSLGIDSFAQNRFDKLNDLTNSNTFKEKRNSLEFTPIIIPNKCDIQLDPDPEKAVAQIYQLVQFEDQLCEKILEILNLPAHTREIKLEILTEGLVKYGEQASANAKQQESFLDALAELSLFPESHSLLCRMYTDISGKDWLREKIFALHLNRDLVSTLCSFTNEGIKREKPDASLFRGASNFCALLSGSYVSHHLTIPLTIFLKKNLVMKNFDPDKAKQYTSFFRKKTKLLLKELGTASQLLEAVRKARIFPIQKHFSDKPNLTTLIRIGIVDMLFLRGVCPFIASCDGVEFSLRIAFTKFLQYLVNDSHYADAKLQPLNKSLKKLSSVVEKFFKKF